MWYGQGVLGVTADETQRILLRCPASIGKCPFLREAVLWISNWPMLATSTPKFLPATTLPKGTMTKRQRHRLASASSPACDPKMKGTTKGPFPQGRPGCIGGLARSIRRDVVGHEANGAASAWSASAIRANSFWPGPNGRHDTARTASFIDMITFVVERTRCLFFFVSFPLVRKTPRLLLLLGWIPLLHQRFSRSFFFLFSFFSALGCHAGRFQPQQEGILPLRPTTVLLDRNPYSRGSDFCTPYTALARTLTVPTTAFLLRCKHFIHQCYIQISWCYDRSPSPTSWGERP